jgi:hypothetical protein
MPRIRSIKPEIVQSETIGQCSRDARLLFVLLWTIADDAGRTRAAPRLLASILFPYDEDAAGLIEGWLSELERVGCVRRYACDGSAYLDIPGWLKHQKIDKPSASRLPAPEDAAPIAADKSPSPDENSTNPREPSPNPHRTLAPDLGSRKGSRKGGTQDHEQDAREAEERAEQFGKFWRAWPNRVAKSDAESAFKSAFNAPGFDLEEILAGVARYERDKPADQKWLNPKTFIEKRRWEDEPAPVSQSRPTNGHQPSASNYFAKAARKLDAEMEIENEQHNREPDAFEGPTIDLSVKRLS